MDKYNITIYDIAREAEVSPATVSRILTGNAVVSEEKRQRVEEVIKKYNFRPNVLARSLSKKESKTIGFILPDITNPFFSSVFMEAERYALNLGYTMMLCDSMNNQEIEYNHLRALSGKQVDAIIFMGGRVNEVETKPKYAEQMNEILKRTPIIIVNGKMSGVDCHKIVTNEEQGIKNLVEYLISIGHKDICLLGGMDNITSTAIKRKAFNNVMDKHGIKKNEKWIINSLYSIEDGFKAMSKILKMKKKPTAVMAINDFVAIGAMRAIKKADIKVPEDISITGFDGTYLAEVTDPQMTTVSQNYEKLGQTIMEVLVDVVNNNFVEKTTVVETELIIRESCSTKS